MKGMKGRTETFRGSFIPDAIKRYNYNQKGNVIDRNDNVTKCGFVSRNILGRRCKPLEARAAGNVAA